MLKLLRFYRFQIHSQILKAADGAQSDTGPEADNGDLWQREAEKLDIEHENRNTRHLQGRLPLAEGACSNDHLVGGGGSADSSDDKVPGEKDDDEQGGNAIEMCEHDQCGADEDFVGDGVHDFSHCADHAIFSGEVAIEIVTERGQ